MKISEISKLVGITPKNIRFYEEQKLVEVLRNDVNGYRQYTEDHIVKLKKIKLFRMLGLSVKDIKNILMHDLKLNDILEKRACEIDSKMRELKVSKELNQKLLLTKGFNVDNMLNEFNDKGIIYYEENLNIINSVPECFREKYYESVIKNGELDNFLKSELISYYKSIFNSPINKKEVIESLLKKSTNNKDIYEKIECYDLELANELSKKIYNFEEVIDVDSNILLEIINSTDLTSIIKALKGASVIVNDLFEQLLPGVDVNLLKKELGPIRIREVEDIQRIIIDEINKIRTCNSV